MYKYLLDSHLQCSKKILSPCSEPSGVRFCMSSNKSKSGSIKCLCTVICWYWSPLARLFEVLSVPYKTKETSSLFSANTYRWLKNERQIQGSSVDFTIKSFIATDFLILSASYYLYTHTHTSFRAQLPVYWEDGESICWNHFFNLNIAFKKSALIG